VSPLWTPNSIQQTLGYFSEADELLYGGAAGGGKTDLLLGLAITAHSKSIIFRREYGQLAEILLRSHELLDGTGAKFNGQDNAWRDIPGSRRLEFGAVQFEKDKEKYKGRPHDGKFFDELSDFRESQYQFITAWSRTSNPHQRVRIIGASNPPVTDEGQWVIHRWRPWLNEKYSNPALPGELRWFTMIDGIDTEVKDGKTFTHKGMTLWPKSRTFIPAKWTDNPAMVETGYGSTLQALPEPLRSLFLEGKFFVSTTEDPWQVIPSRWVDAAMIRDVEKPEMTTSLGVDPARGGRDDGVVASLLGVNYFDDLFVRPGIEILDGPMMATFVLDVLDAYGGEPNLMIDLIGWGSSAYDILVYTLPFVYGINFAEASGEVDNSGRLGFYNQRAEYWWKFREALDPTSGMNLRLPEDEFLRQELVSPRWKLTSRGILVESKEEIHKRLGRSTNRADAVILAYGGVETIGESIYHGTV